MTSDSTGFKFGDTLTDDEVKALGDALYGLSKRSDYQIFMRFLERMGNEIGRYGMRDATKTRDYYQGYLDAVDTLRLMPDFYIARSQEVLAREREEGAAVNEALGSFRSGGNLTTEGGE